MLRNGSRIGLICAEQAGYLDLKYIMIHDVITRFELAKPQFCYRIGMVYRSGYFSPERTWNSNLFWQYSGKNGHLLLKLLIKMTVWNSILWINRQNYMPFSCIKFGKLWRRLFDICLAIWCYMIVSCWRRGALPGIKYSLISNITQLGGFFISGFKGRMLSIGNWKNVPSSYCDHTYL